MSFKIDMSSPDLDRQLDLMKHYPEVMEKHFKNAIVVDVSKLYSTIKKNVPSKRAKATIKRSVGGKGINLQGKVGWWGKGTFWQVNILEYGAKPHDMNTYVPGLGKRIKKHPGFSAMGFMAAGYSAIKPQIDNDMKLASEAVLKEMVIK